VALVHALQEALGLPALDATKVQFALRKLGDRNIVGKSARNQFVFDSAAFEGWVKTLAVQPVARWRSGRMKRYLDDLVAADLQRKLVFVTGVRQVGKTTLSRQLQAAVPSAQ